MVFHFTDMQPGLVCLYIDCIVSIFGRAIGATASETCLQCRHACYKSYVAAKTRVWCHKEDDAFVLRSAKQKCHRNIVFPPEGSKGSLGPRHPLN